jgi:hypothetical protein
MHKYHDTVSHDSIKIYHLTNSSLGDIRICGINKVIDKAKVVIAVRIFAFLTIVYFSNKMCWYLMNLIAEVRYTVSAR